MDLNYIIFYINLKKNINRRKIFEKKYLNIYRIDAINGHKIDSYKENIDISDFKLKEVMLKNKCTPPYLGCSLSHLKAIITAHRNNLNEVIIMEDDIFNTYNEHWKEPIQNIIDNSPKDLECLKLHNMHPVCISENLKNNNKYIRVSTREHLGGAGCYYMNRKGIEKIYNLYFKNNKIHIHSSFCDGISDGDLIFTKINTYMYKYPLFDHQIKYSTIHSEDLIDHTASLILIDNYYRNQNNQLINKFVCFVCRIKLNKENLKNNLIHFCKNCFLNKSYYMKLIYFNLYKLKHNKLLY